MNLRLTDTTNNIDLVSVSPVTGCTYFPSTASKGDKDIVETATVNLTGTPVAILAVTNGIERFFDQARDRAALGVGTRIYVEYRSVSNQYYYRSEILDGKILWSDDSAKRRLETTSGTATVQIGVMWQRRVWADGTSWENSTELEIGLVSKATTIETVNGVTIHDHNDSGHGNWVEIDYLEIIGTGAAPVRISMQNTSGSDQDYTNIYIATNAHSNPQNFAHVIEGEATTSGGSTSGDTSSSNGNYQSVTVSGGGTGLAWNLSTTQVRAGAGRDFQIIARLVSIPSAPIYVTPMIKDAAGLIPLASGLEVSVNSTDTLFQLVRLGALPIPPGAVDADTLSGAVLYLGLRCDTSATFAIDFIQLTPTESLRHLYQRGYTVASNEYIEDDGVNGIAFITSGGLQYPIVIQKGSPVKVWPQTRQRIYFLFDVASGSVPISASMKVRMYYRPRRHSV